MSYRLGGRNSLPYLGVEAPTPANTVIHKRSPTPTDSQNVNIVTWWLKTNNKNSAEEVWILISLVQNVATWVQIYPSNAGGASEFVEDVGVANELAGVISVLSGATSVYNNINTLGFGNTIEIRLNDTIQLPNTTTTGTAGVIYLGGQRFMHDYGTNCTFLGQFAGSLTNATNDNTGIGDASMALLQPAAARNSGLGSGSLFNITTGTNNVGLGYLGGGNYTTENFNICIFNNGTIGDNNTIRIGNSVNHNTCYISGIYNTTINSDAPKMVLQNNTEKLGASTITSTGGTINVTFGAGTINFDTNSSGGLDGSSFMAVVSPNVEPLPSPASGIFFIGAQQPMVVLYDNFGGAFFPGNGLGFPATFTASVNGFYEFYVNIVIGQLGVCVQLDALINVNAAQYAMSRMTINNGGSTRIAGVNLAAMVQLTAGDTVTFSSDMNASFINPPYGFVGNNLLGRPNNTFVMGKLLKTF